MKELDFDELDKAVNNLMTKAQKPSDQTADQPDVATEKVDAPKQAEPNLAGAGSEPSISADRPRPATPRRSGRFMDVVHPSSDMKTATNSPKPSREGIAVTPLSQVTDSEPASKWHDVKPVQPAVETETAQSEDGLGSTSTVSQSIEDEAKQVEDLSKTESFSTDEATNNLDQNGASGFPQTSPFLPDAKVEKRPLGSFNSSEISEEAKPESDEKPVESPTTDNKQPVDGLTEAKKPLQPELQSELVALESGGDATNAEPDAAEAPKLAEQQPPAKTEPALGTKREEILANNSIPQQYKQSPSTGDTSHTAIYDVDDAHKVLQHPAKKKSGWLWVVWIILILVISMGLGAAAYFMMLS